MLVLRPVQVSYNVQQLTLADIVGFYILVEKEQDDNKSSHI